MVTEKPEDRVTRRDRSTLSRKMTIEVLLRGNIIVFLYICLGNLR